MYTVAKNRIKKLVVAGDETLLQGGLKGIERESLRVGPDGSVSLAKHPRAWGSPLTHPYITTDYSEALTELVTPAFADTNEVSKFLTELHQYLYENMPTGELLWSASMPCAVGDDQAIPIAEYGTSNIGRLKHIYRVGLDYRYGRRMQAIAGVHFNYSAPQELWAVLQEEEDDAGSLRDFIDEKYFGLIRNFRRTGWLVPFLFGNSPAVCKSFLGGRTTRFKEFDQGTHYLPHATSLRMSDIGYKNKNQSALKVSYNDLDSYVSSLLRAIRTPYPEYEAIGIKDGDDYLQLNTNVLQIENEYYSFVRPKRTTNSGEKPSAALRDRGVEYVEIRALDVNAFSPIGVTSEQLHFLEAFLLFNLLEPSPAISDAEQHEIEYNELTVALRGRQEGLTLQYRQSPKSLAVWVDEILDSVGDVANALDSGTGKTAFADAVKAQRDALNDYERLPSAAMLSGMSRANLPFAKYALALSEDHQNYFSNNRLSDDMRTKLTQLAERSLEEQQAVEAADSVSFDEFLASYFAD
ncbi:MAG: glutamate--cysteine ligase [Gammaproteobacteria bacterium]